MSSGRFLGGLALGGLLGAVLALLLAPKSGEDTRRWLGKEFKDRTDDIGDELKKHAHDLRGCIDDMADKAKEKAHVSVDEFRERVQKVASGIEDSARTFIESARNGKGREEVAGISAEESPN